MVVIKDPKIPENIVMTGTDDGDLVVVTNFGKIFKLNAVDGWISIPNPIKD